VQNDEGDQVPADILEPKSGTTRGSVSAKYWSRRRDLNPRPADYETRAGAMPALSLSATIRATRWSRTVIARTLRDASGLSVRDQDSSEGVFGRRITQDHASGSAWQASWQQL